MSLPLLFAGAVLANLIVLSRIVYRRFFNPVFIFSGIWFLAIAGVLAGPIRYTEVSWTASWFIIASHVSFFVGAAAMKLWGGGCHRRVGSPPSLSLLRSRMAGASLLLIIVGMLGSVLSLLVFQRDGVFDLYISSPETFRNQLLSEEIRLPQGILLLISINFAAAALSGLYCGMFFRHSRFIAMFSLSGLFAATMIGFGEAALVWGGMLFISSYSVGRFSIARKPIRSREVWWWGILAAVAASLIIATRIIRGSGDIEGVYRFMMRAYYDETLRYGPSSPFVIFFIHLFQYFTSSLPALSSYLDTHSIEWSFGAYTFRPFFQYVLGAPAVDFRWDTVYVPFNVNVFSAIRTTLADFGVAGLLAFNAALGMFVSYWFMKVRAAPTLAGGIVLSYCYTFLLYSLFLPLTYATMFWVSLGIVIVVSPLFVRGKSKAI